MKTFKQHAISEAFTRQHYVTIAKIIKDEIDISESEPHTQERIGRLAEKLAKVFKADNPNFNENQFLNACGV